MWFLTQKPKIPSIFAHFSGFQGFSHLFERIFRYSAHPTPQNTIASVFAPEFDTFPGIFRVFRLLRWVSNRFLWKSMCRRRRETPKIPGTTKINFWTSKKNLPRQNRQNHHFPRSFRRNHSFFAEKINKINENHQKIKKNE